jgi:CHAT domain-containing protein
MKTLGLAFGLALCGALFAPASLRAENAPLAPADQPAAADASLIDEAFLAAQAGFASQAGAALRQMETRAASGDGALAGLLRERQALANRLAAVEDALTEPDADRTLLFGQADGLRAEMEALTQRQSAEFPRFDEITRPRPLSIAEVQALLAPDEAMLMTFVGENATYVWAISARQAGWHMVPAGRETLSGAVQTLRSSLDPTAPARAATALDPVPLGKLPFSRDTAYLLYAYLFAPLEPVFSRAAHVFIVADGPLTSLPFSLLITDWEPGEDSDAAVLRASRWMIRRHALTVLPTAEALRVVRKMPPPAADRLAFVGFGDPQFEGELQVAALSRGVLRSGLADVDQLRALSPLPQTRRELLEISETLGKSNSVVRLGAQATETAVKTFDLSKAKVLAFATHGLLSGDLSGLEEPALVLTPPQTASAADDGLLTASEIADLRLDADWVVLSACNTAGGDKPGAEGLSGLARAFLFAGARSILVSHWPVRDDAAARLTTDAFARMADGSARGRAEALRQSMLSLMADPRDPSLAHPSAWAPFVLVGEGGAGR